MNFLSKEYQISLVLKVKKNVNAVPN